MTAVRSARAATKTTKHTPTAQPSCKDDAAATNAEIEVRPLKFRRGNPKHGFYAKRLSDDEAALVDELEATILAQNPEIDTDVDRPILPGGLIKFAKSLRPEPSSKSDRVLYTQSCRIRRYREAMDRLLLSRRERLRIERGGRRRRRSARWK